MVCGNVEILQTFLNCNSDNTAATPQPDNEGGAKPALGNSDTQAVGILEQLGFSNVVFGLQITGSR